MRDENHDIPQESLPDAFANKFENKIIRNLTDLNDKMPTLKIKMKRLFLTLNND